jgi:diguanylate cyclase (GGDEF)-like protein
MTASLTVLAVALTIPIARRNPDVIGIPAIAVGITALLFLANVVPLRIDFRRQSFAISVADLPLLIALFFLPPLAVLLVRLVVVSAMQVMRRNGVVRSAFNVASFAAGTATANFVVASLGIEKELHPRTWLVLALAVVAYSVVTMAAVGGVLALTQGPAHLPQFLRTVPMGLMVTAVNVTVGLIMLLALKQNPWSVLLIAGLAVVLGMVLRAYAKFLRQHRSLAEIHDITQAITASVPEGRLADVVLGRVRQLLNAESATLWLPARSRHPEILLTATVDYRGLLDRPRTPDRLRQQAVAVGTPVTIGAKLNVGETTGEVRRRLRQTEGKDTIIVPLRSGNAVIGTLEVAGRMGDAHFTPDDVRLVETLAAHVGVAVENSRLVDRLRFDANYDALTGLPNRRRLLAALGESIAARAQGEIVAILQFDVLGLRNVNDSLGHRAGNEVLVEVARRLRALAPDAALVGRVGGDELAVILPTAGLDSAMALADQIRAGLREPMRLDALTIDVDTTVGVAAYPDHGEDPDTLLQRADVATHAAKNAAGSQAYNAGLESRSVRRLGLAADLRRALDRGEIEVYFQPKVALADRRVVGVECLARWEHPVYGSVTPEDFVAVAEHTGQVAQLTELVLREGLRRAREWADAGRALSVAVNVSARSLADSSWPARVDELLREYGVAPGRLTLEVGEEALLGDPGRAYEALRRLRAIGVRLAVDDFGTGYSSLVLLRRLPIDEVKIDRTFVQGMATDAGDLAIVRAVVDLSRHFDLVVVAEGVESELTVSLLTDIGCDCGQGFLFSRPLPYERLDAWLHARTETEPPTAGEVRWLRAVP